MTLSPFRIKFVEFVRNNTIERWENAIPEGWGVNCGGPGLVERAVFLDFIRKVKSSSDEELETFLTAREVGSMIFCRMVYEAVDDNDL